MAFDGTLKFDTAIDKTGFKLGLDGLGSIAKTSMKAVMSAVTAASGTVAALGGYAISVGKDFEGSMATVIATMGITKDTIQDGVNSYDLLREAAAAAGESTTFSASEAADALNYLALAGYSASGAAKALPAVLGLAAAGGLDLAYASDLATDAMAALGIEATSENLTEFGDKLAKAASTANASVSDLGEAILTVGGTAKSLAGGTTELNAALGVLANRGIKGAEGGTALRNIILALSAPTDKAAAAMKSLGVEAFDAEGNMRPLNEVFRDLDSALAGMSEGEKTQVLNEIFNKVDLKSAQAMLAGCGDEFDDLTSALDSCDGAMADMAHTMNDTLEGDLKALSSRTEAFGIAIYENLNEPLRELAQLGGEYISQLTDAFRNGGFEGLAESLGDVLGQAVTKISEYIPSIAEMGASVITEFVNGIIDNMGAISEAASQIMVIIVDTAAQVIPQVIQAGMQAIGALAQGLAEEAPRLADAAAEGMSQLMAGIAENLPLIAESAVSILSSIADSLSKNLPELKNSAKQLIQSFADMLRKNLPELVTAAVSILTSLAETLADNIDVLLDAALETLEVLAEALVENIGPLIDALVQIIISLADYISENADEMTRAVIDIVEAIVVCLVENAPKLLAAAVIMLGAIIKAIPQILGELGAELARLGGLFFDWMEEVGGDALMAVGSWLSDTLDAAVEGAEDIISGIMEFFGELPGKIADTLSEAFDSAVGWAEDMCRKASDTGREFLDNIGDFFRRLPGDIKSELSKALNSVADWALGLVQKGENAAGDLVDTIVNGISSLPDKLKNIGKQLVEGLWEGIRNAKDWLWDKITDFGGGIVDGFKDVFGIRSPSRVMRDSVGRYLAQGIGEGFTEEIPAAGEAALRAMERLEILKPDIELPLLKLSPETDRTIAAAPGAVSALVSQLQTADSGLDRPSAVSEVVNNHYSYSTVNNSSAAPSGAESQPVNIQLIVGSEVIAEGVADIAGDKMDRAQGQRVRLRKRGLAY